MTIIPPNPASAAVPLLDVTAALFDGFTMSKTQIEQALLGFFETPKPEVLCISGKWGVGKTYMFKKQLERAQGDEAINLKRYAYVSLFGVNSLSELKYSIFENTVKREELSSGPNIDTIRQTINAASSMGRRRLSLVRTVAPSMFENAAPSLFLTVREQLICIDDMERHGQNVRIRDVLGLISFLKYERDCKVVLILNDGEMDETDQKDYTKFKEKVIDRTFVFDPTPAEAADLAFDIANPLKARLTELCVGLQIKNVRTLIRIRDWACQLSHMLQGFSEGTKEQALRTLTIACWCLYTSPNAPSFEFLKDRWIQIGYTPDRKNLSNQEQSWLQTLRTLGPSSLDDFDYVLIAGLERGVIDQAQLLPLAKILDRKFEVQSVEYEFEQAWKLFRDSFDDNAQEFCDALFKAGKAVSKTLAPWNLNGAVSILKSLGEPDKAKDLLDHYIQERKDEKGLFDIKHNEFAFRITDQDVIDAFNKHFTAISEVINPRQLFLKMAEEHTWTQDDLENLSNITQDDFYSMFKETRSPDWNRVLGLAVEFSKLSGPPNEVWQKARQALQVISRESTINSLRLRNLGLAEKEQTQA